MKREQDPNTGRVMRFGAGAAYLRRRAKEHRSHGRLLEATELYRLALQQEETAATEFDLADTLHRMGCEREASEILYGLCAEKDVPRGVYYLLALTLRALGDTEAAVDALCHDLQQDSESEQSDDAREMLSELTEDEEEHESFRLSALIRRGLQDVSEGQKERGMRRLKRALILARRKAPLAVTLAMLCMSEGDYSGAMTYAAAAVREEHNNLRARSVMCMILWQTGKKRMARATLAQMKQVGAHSPVDDDLICVTAEGLEDTAFERAYLQERLRETPCAIHLLSRLADTAWRAGETELSCSLWDRMLRIDPDNIRARVLTRWQKEHQGEELPVDGVLPKEEFMTLLGGLAEAIAHDEGTEALIARGSEMRPVVRWVFTLQDAKLQGMVASWLGHEDTELTRRVLSRLLTNPTVLTEVKRQILYRLTELDGAGEHAVLIGRRLTVANCEKREQNDRSEWQTFLRRLLVETRHYGQSAQIAAFAAKLWNAMSRDMRADAAGTASYVWVKAAEVLYLRMTWQLTAVQQVADTLPISPRRVDRAMKKLIACAKLEIPDPQIPEEMMKPTDDEQGDETK